MPRTKKTEEVKEVALNTDAEEIIENEEALKEDFAADVEEDDVPELDEDEMEEFIAVMTKMYQKRRYNMMSKSESKAAYKNDRIVGKRGTDYKTEKDKVKDEAKLLMEAAQSVPPRILTGEVYGSEFTEHGIPLMLVKLTEKDTGYFIIKIPVSQFFMYDPKTYAGDEGERALLREIDSRIGSTVEFVVYNILEKEGYAYGSRLKAMELRSAKYYKPKKSAGSNGEVTKEKAPEIVAGTRALARVTSVKNNRVKVEIKGAEAELKSEDLSWRALEELTEEFEVGQEFEVIVKDVTPVKYDSMGNTYNLFVVKASKKEADPNPADMYFDKFFVKQRIKGVVKSQTETGVFVDLSGMMDCLCPAPAVGRAIRGEKCLIEITEKDEKKKHLYGRFLRV